MFAIERGYGEAKNFINAHIHAKGYTKVRRVIRLCLIGTGPDLVFNQ